MNKEAIELPPEQREELERIVQELKKTQGSITSLPAVFAAAWLQYLQSFLFLAVIQNTADQARMRQQMQTEHRRWVKFLSKQMKRSPTVEDAISSWPQMAGLSPALAETIRQDLVEMEKPVVRRSRSEAQADRTQKLLARIDASRSGPAE